MEIGKREILKKNCNVLFLYFPSFVSVPLFISLMQESRCALPRACKKRSADTMSVGDGHGHGHAPCLVLGVKDVLVRSIVATKGLKKVVSLKEVARLLLLSNANADVEVELSHLLPRYVISDADVLLLAYVVTGLPEEALKITQASILLLLKAFLTSRRKLVYETAVYDSFFFWLKTIEELGGVPFREEDVALMRTVALMRCKARPHGYTHALRHLPLLFAEPAMNEAELKMLHEQVPESRAVCVAPELVWRQVVRTDEDLMHLDVVLRGAWGMPPAADVLHECAVCFEEKPRCMFAMLSCERHLLCATCVLQYRRVGSDVAGLSKVTTRCPMRCQYRCVAMPLAAYERQVAEMGVFVELQALLFSSLPAPPFPVALRAGDYVRVRLAGSVHKWVRVDAVLGAQQRVARASVNGYPIVVLARSDVVLSVMRHEGGSVPVNTQLSEDDLEAIEAQSRHSITYVGRACGKAAHFHHCEDGNEETGAWVRVTHPVERNTFSVRHGSDKSHRSLKELHAVMQASHDMAPTMLASACRCMQDRGFHLATQLCVRCRHATCVTCFGSVASVCAFCRACDAIGPDVVERFE